VQEIMAGGLLFTVDGSGYNPLTGKINSPETTFEDKTSPALLECLRAGLLCNDSQLVEKNGGWQVQGDPTEGALLTSARKGGLGQEIVTEYPRLDTVPFESEHQYMATLHDTGPDNASRLIYLKGAVEAVLTRCETQIDAQGNPVPLQATEIHSIVEAMAAKGLRVLAMARKKISPETRDINHGDLTTDLVFLGLQGMIDPPRPEAIAAVKTCQAAGILVKMITGDHPITAMAIAEQVGLANSPSCSQTMTARDGLRQKKPGTQAKDGPVSQASRMAQERLAEAVPVLTGPQLAKLSDSELISVAATTDVFARVTPEQKLRLVEALQSTGQVVAMTGDG
ncbi:MAG: HAD family hydrolase, partial [Desulfocapsaceae bacterium]|nr:HAD family hydrolase [Desulfocapsaceae bacterium]